MHIIAHRGASAYLPEHTLEGKAFAYAQGADFLEQDVVLSRDGRTIVHHDLVLDYTTDVAERFPGRARPDGLHYVIDFDWFELMRLRFFERRDQDGKQRYPDRFPTSMGIFRLHTLEKEIQLIKGMNRSTKRRVGLYLELKDPSFHKKNGQDITKVVWKQLMLAGFERPDSSTPCFIQCFEPGTLMRLRHELGCPLPLVQLVGRKEWRMNDVDYDALVSTEGLDEVASYAAGIAPSIGHIIQSFGKDGPKGVTKLVPEAKKRNLLVHPYTFRAEDMPAEVSFEALLRYFIQEAKVDGVFTDAPDIVRKVREQLNA